MTKQEWIQDIDIFVDQLEKNHPNPYNNYYKEEFYKKIEEVKNNNGQLTKDELYRNLCLLTALLKDAHTFIIPIGTDFEIPLLFKLIDNKVYIANTREINKQALYKEVLFINDISTQTILEELKQLISCETDAFLNFRIEKVLSNPSILKRLKIIDNDILNVIYENEGNTDCLNFDCTKTQEFSDMICELNNSSCYDYRFIKEHNTLYIRYSRCMEDKNYKVDELLDDVDEEMKQGVEKIIIDIRDNVGGNSQIIKPIINRLREYKEDNVNIFCLVNNGTFSSGMSALFDLLNIGAITIGSETGGTIGERFGEVISFLLPNSKINVYCSTKRFNATVSDSKNQSYVPNYLVEPTIEDLKMGIDIALSVATNNDYINENVVKK